ncbi:MAG: imelysin family protein [Thermomicrobiales bacterium]
MFCASHRERVTRVVMGLAVLALIMPGAIASAQTPTATEPDLTGLKTYMIDHADAMKAGTAELVALAQQYHDLVAQANGDYAALWQQHGKDLAPWLEQARSVWIEQAHGNYERIEGMVAGIPSLSHFDDEIDAGASKEDVPTGAPNLQVTLPDGTVLDRPGNLFHYLTEPALWGTNDAFVALRVDLNGDGTVAPTEALPDANLLLGSAQALDARTADLETAIAGWQPNDSDAFTALVVMIPTMSGYFEEWKLSPFVLGDKSTSQGFVANSRLLDVLGILGGLDVTYDRLAPLVDTADPALQTEIRDELDGLVAFVQDLHDQEDAGTRFTPDQADLFGNELQSRATALAGQIVQAAALLNIPLEAE